MGKSKTNGHEDGEADVRLSAGPGDEAPAAPPESAGADAATEVREPELRDRKVGEPTAAEAEAGPKGRPSARPVQLATVAVKHRPDAEQLRIAFIGGTGPEGLGLAMRLTKAGHMVYIGSRSDERAAEAVAKVKARMPDGDVFGGPNLEGAAKADIVFLTVPYDAHESTLEELAEAIGDKILVDVVVPMVWDRDGPRAIPVEDGSAAQQARRIAGRAKVVSGFHHIDGQELQKVEKPLQGDILICSDHKAAKKTVIELAEEIEYVRGLDAGGLQNARYLEEWTVVLLHLNKIHRARTGIRITGV